MSPHLTIYRASAGSGKTFTLTAEYIALLLATPQSHEAEHILAVTFTNKATAEMKNRILASLYAIGHDLQDSKGMLNAVIAHLEQKGIQVAPSVLRNRAKTVLTSILHDYGHFRVETIDSFFQSILHTLARELGLASGMRIELNNKQVVSRAVDRVMEHLAERPPVRQWVLDYVREQIESSDHWDIRGGMNSLGTCIYEETYQSRQEQVRRTSEEEQEQKTQFKRTLWVLRNQHETHTRQGAQELILHINSQCLNFDRISHGQDTLAPFLQRASLMGTDSGRGITYEMPTSRITNAMQNPEKLLRAADRKNGKLMDEATETARRLEHFCTNYSESLHILNSIRLALHYLPPLRLLGTIEEEATLISAEAGQFLLSRTAALLSQMVDRTDAPFVLERAGVQFRHIMIDEFQDTSRMQWNNFRSLLLENIATGGDSLLVGDVKQSIYRWRGGDWEILQGAKRELANLLPHELTLDTNWRSLPEVVNFNNDFFPKAASLLDAQDCDARFKLSDIYRDVAQKCAYSNGMQGMASVCLYKKQRNSKPEDYEERMVGEMVVNIRELKQQGVQENEIAILVRRNSTAARLLTLFHDMAPDISLVSDEAFLLQASVSVQMLIAALQLIADGMEKLDPVVLRYLMLHYQQDVQGIDIPLCQVMEQHPQDVLPRELTSMREQMLRLPLHQLTERLYHTLQLERIEGQDAYVLTFMDELQTYLRDNPQDIYQLLQAWTESIATRPIPGGETGGIRILTIHKSKGLEYHTVLLPYMDWNMGIDSMHENLLWCSTGEEPFNQLGPLPIRLSRLMEHSAFGSDYQEEMLQRRVDTLNMIYVAFTRARCNLMTWGVTSVSRKLTCVGDLIYNTLEMHEEEDTLRYQQGILCGSLFGNRQAKEPPEPKKQDEQRMHMPHGSHNAQDITMSTRPPSMHFMPSSQSYRFIRSLGDEASEYTQADSYIETGKLMHYALSQIGCSSEASAVMDKIEAEGLAEQSQAWKKARRAIEHGLANPIVSQWFAPGKRFVRECNIICKDPQTAMAEVKRPDRVVIEPGLISVIDYKFGKKKQEYTTQVQEYMRHISAMYPNTEVQGWLWYVYSGHTERVYSNATQQDTERT